MQAHIVNFMSTRKHLGRNELVVPSDVILMDAELDGYADLADHGIAHDENSAKFMTPEIQIRGRGSYPQSEHDTFFGEAHKVLHVFKAHAPFMIGFRTLQYYPKGVYRVAITLTGDYYNVGTKGKQKDKRIPVGNIGRFRAIYSTNGADFTANDLSPDGWEMIQNGKRATYYQNVTLNQRGIIGWQLQIPISHAVNGFIITDMRLHETIDNDALVTQVVQQNERIEKLEGQITDVQRRLEIIEL